jgi:ribulose 1,5-bisphosphate synthetase/thiazole synthase
MRRRNFLTHLSLITGGALVTSRATSGAEVPGAPAKDGEAKTAAGKITEPAREIPIVAQADVVVVGGGPAGVAAAIGAARAGASTILVERYNCLGGLWTGGLVLPLLATHGTGKDGKRRQVLAGVGGEMAQRLAGMKMAIHEIDPVVDPEAAKYVMEVMVQDAGIQVLYHCWAGGAVVKDGVIQALLLESKAGRVAVVPKVVVDCTGDGDVMEWAGETFENMRYHIGLVHRLGNVDRIDKNKPGYKKMPIGNPTPLKSVNWVNMHGDKNQDGLDLFALAKLQQKYRIEIWKQVEKIRATPGHEDVFLLEVAPQLGVRMSRILDGQYRLTFDESMTYKTFDDAIGVSGAWTSVVHGGKKVGEGERPAWQIPYRSLVPKKTKNLLVAGRCFCFDKALVEDARVIGTCMITGHGAGVAAAVAVKTGSSVQDADVAKVRATLTEQKAYLG